MKYVPYSLFFIILFLSSTLSSEPITPTIYEASNGCISIQIYGKQHGFNSEVTTVLFYFSIKNRCNSDVILPLETKFSFEFLFDYMFPYEFIIDYVGIYGSYINPISVFAYSEYNKISIKPSKDFRLNYNESQNFFMRLYVKEILDREFPIVINNLRVDFEDKIEK